MSDNQKCTATCKDGSECGNYPVNGEDKCRMHLGKTVDGESHKDNDFAQKHSLHADRGKFYNRLPENKQAAVDRFESALIDRYQAFHGRDPDPADVKDMFEIAVGYAMRDFAREYMVDEMEKSGNPLLKHVEMEKDGEKVEFDTPNEIAELIEGSRKEDRMQRKTKGLEKDPESQTAAALADGIDLHLSSEDKEDLDSRFDVTPDT